jgi:hypothetical protein
MGRRVQKIPRKQLQNKKDNSKWFTLGISWENLTPEDLLGHGVSYRSIFFLKGILAAEVAAHTSEMSGALLIMFRCSNSNTGTSSDTSTSTMEAAKSLLMVFRSDKAIIPVDQIKELKHLAKYLPTKA